MVSLRSNSPPALRHLKLCASCGAMWNCDFWGAGFGHFVGCWATRFILKLWNLSACPPWLHVRARSGCAPHACPLPSMTGFPSKGSLEAQASGKLGLLWTDLEESVSIPGYPRDLQTRCSVKVSYFTLSRNITLNRYQSYSQSKEALFYTAGYSSLL